MQCQFQEIINYLHDIMGGCVAFTLQAVDRTQLKHLWPQFSAHDLSPSSYRPLLLPLPGAAEATAIQELFVPISAPRHSAGIPHHLHFRTVHAVPELWRKWTCGLGGKPSIQSLENTYGAAWRLYGSEGRWAFKRSPRCYKVAER
jgi:hypothetical protein